MQFLLAKFKKLFLIEKDKNQQIHLAQRNAMTHEQGGEFVAHFSILQTYKGEIRKTIEVYSNIGSTCTGDYSNIQVDDIWTIYADYYAKSKQWFTDIGMCGDSRKGVSETFLKDFLEGKTSETIIGVLSHFDSAPDLGNLSFRVEGEGFKSSGIASNSIGSQEFENEFFSINVPKPGKYKVNLILPAPIRISNFDESIKLTKFPNETERNLEYLVEVPKGLCSYIQFIDFPKDLIANAAIFGKFSFSRGKIPANFSSKLCRLKETEKETLNENNCYSDFKISKNGEFAIDGLREGKYVIVVNDKDFPELNSPYLKHYFPGVRKFEEAQIIEIRQGQATNIQDFRLPSPFQRKNIKGKLFWKKAIPVTKNTIGEYGVFFEFFNPNEPEQAIYSMSSYVLPNTTQDGITLYNDGNFTFQVFEGFNYTIRFWVADTKGIEFSREINLKVDKKTKPLQIILKK